MFETGSSQAAFIGDEHVDYWHTLFFSLIADGHNSRKIHEFSKGATPSLQFGFAFVIPHCVMTKGPRPEDAGACVRT